MSTAADRAARRIQSLAHRRPDAVQLARLASLAVRVEPHLLRQLRLELLPQADVGTEADLWFSPLVESHDATGFVLDAQVAGILRDDLARDRPLLQRAAGSTERAHRRAPLTLRLEERITALALMRGDDAVPAIDEALRPALRAMLAGGERAREIALWAMRATPRMHPLTRRSANVLALTLVASDTLGRRRILREFPEGDVGLESVGWTLPASALAERVRVRVRLVEGGLHFDSPAPGLPTIELPRTTPLLIELQWSDAGDAADQRRLVEVVAGRSIDLGTDPARVTITTLAGDEYVLTHAASATTTAGESAPAAPSPWIEIAPFQRVAASCVRVSGRDTEGNRSPWMTAFAASSEHLVTSNQYLRGAVGALLMPTGPGATGSAARPRSADLLNADDQDVRVLRDSEGARPGEPVRFATTGFRGSRKGEAPGLEMDDMDGVVLGFDGDTLRATSGLIRLDDLMGSEFTVLVNARLPDGFLGGPVIIGERVRGLVASMTTDPATGRSVLSAIGAARIIAALRDAQAVATTEAPPDASGSETSDASPIIEGSAHIETPEPLQQASSDSEWQAREFRRPAAAQADTGDDSVAVLPAWVQATCVEVHALGGNITPQTGFVLGENMIVTSPGHFPDGQFVDVNTRVDNVRARVLEGRAEAPALVVERIDARPFATSVPIAEEFVQMYDDPDAAVARIPADVTIVAAVAGRLRAVRGRLRPPRENPPWLEFQVDVAEFELPGEFVGAPIIAGGRVAGMVRDVPHGPQDAGRVIATGIRPILEQVSRLQEERRTRSAEAAAPPRSAASAAEQPGAAGDRVHVTVALPARIAPGSWFAISVRTHPSDTTDGDPDRQESAELQTRTHGPVLVKRGATLTIRPGIIDSDIEPEEVSIVWNGDAIDAEFRVRTPPKAVHGRTPGSVAVIVDGVPIARIAFELGAESPDRERPDITRYRRAYACYASRDRDAVLARLQGIRLVAPDLDVFIDATELQAGARWHDELSRRMAESDVFFLFWSANARASEWVEREWRLALEMKGIDFIMPVPLDPPDMVPPPPELASLHFGDPSLALRNRPGPRP